MDKYSGDIVWSVQLPSFLKINPRKSKEVVAHFGPIVAGGKVILASSDKKIRVFNPVDGSLIDDVTVPSGATSNPVIADNILYFVSRDGDLHAFR